MFVDVPRVAKKIRDHMCETSEVGSKTWFHIFLATLGTCQFYRQEATNRSAGAQILEFEVSVRHVSMGAPKNPKPHL